MISNSATPSLPSVSVEHIAFDVNGCAYIAGSGIQVRHLVGLKEAHGYSAEQLQAEAYPQLTLAQIYDALAYYHDHRAAIDRQIEDADQASAREWKTQHDDPARQAFISGLRSRQSSADSAR
jgi:uncharacterized protein (DUF433 family)